MTVDLLERAAHAIESMYVGASTLTRVLRFLGKPDEAADDLDVAKPFAILTAFESGAALESNTRRLAQMRQVLERSGMKIFGLQGNFLEAPEGTAFDEAEEAQKLVHIREDALFCMPKPDVDFKTFESVVTRQADRFGQLALILSDGVTVWIRFKDGHLKDLGDRVDVDSLQAAYKIMRGQREHPFVFE